MQVESAEVSTLEQTVLSLVDASSPSEIFKILLRGSAAAAPRGAVFLVRQGTTKGWGSIGYDGSVAAAQRAFSAPANQGWLGRFVTDPTLGLETGSGGDPDFGQAAASDSAAMAVRVRGRTIALVLIERSEGEPRWKPEALEMLARVGQLRLELDLALRKLKNAADADAPAAPAPVAAQSTEVAAPAPAAAPVETVPEPVTEPVVAEEAPAPVATELEAAPQPSEQNAELAAARRFAKLVATDIRLYNEEAVMLGRREGDLADRLGEQLERGKETFLRRHGSLGSTAAELLRNAYVEVLAAGDASLIPDSLLD